MQALDRGDIAQAERAFRQACGSGDPRADSNLGWFYFLMGGSVRDSEAEARYWIQKALQRSRHPRILQNIARLRFENGDFAGALAALLLMLAAARLGVALGRGAGVGGGDVKLLAASALWTGPVWGLALVGASCAVGLCAHGVAWLARRAFRSDAAAAGGIPLGPSIAVCLLDFVLGP